jgi:hypothetical protein
LAFAFTRIFGTSFGFGLGRTAGLRCGEAGDWVGLRGCVGAGLRGCVGILSRVSKKI